MDPKAVYINGPTYREARARLNERYHGWVIDAVEDTPWGGYKFDISAPKEIRLMASEAQIADEFMKMLQRAKADAWDEGYDRALADDGWSPKDASKNRHNPYRGEAR